MDSNILAEGVLKDWQEIYLSPLIKKYHIKEAVQKLTDYFINYSPATNNIDDLFDYLQNSCPPHIVLQLQILFMTLTDPTEENMTRFTLDSMFFFNESVWDAHVGLKGDNNSLERTSMETVEIFTTLTDEIIRLYQMQPRLLSALLIVLWKNLLVLCFVKRDTRFIELIHALIDKNCFPENLHSPVCECLDVSFLDFGTKNSDSDFFHACIPLLPAIAEHVKEEELLNRISHLFSELCQSKAGVLMNGICLRYIDRMALLLGSERTKTLLIPPFKILCTHNMFNIRKSCAEKLSKLSSVIQDDQLKWNDLTDGLFGLLNDTAPWVRTMAFEQLGPFLATFADADKTGLRLNQRGHVERVYAEEPFHALYTSPLHQVLAKVHHHHEHDEDSASQALSGQVSNSAFAPHTTSSTRMVASNRQRSRTSNSCSVAPGDTMVTNITPTASQSLFFPSRKGRRRQLSFGEHEHSSSSRHILPDADCKEDDDVSMESANATTNAEENENQDNNATAVANELFESFSYWRDPLPSLEQDDLPPLCGQQSSLDDDDDKPFGSANALQHDLKFVDEEDNDGITSFPTAAKRGSRGLSEGSSLLAADAMMALSDLDDSDNDKCFNEIAKLDNRFTSQKALPPILLKYFLESPESSLHACARYFVAVAYVLGVPHWHILRPLFRKLKEHIEWKIRRSIASCLCELMVILGPHISELDILPVLREYSKDVNEVREGILYNLVKITRTIAYWSSTPPPHTTAAVLSSTFTTTIIASPKLRQQIAHFSYHRLLLPWLRLFNAFTFDDAQKDHVDIPVCSPYFDKYCPVQIYEDRLLYRPAYERIISVKTAIWRHQEILVGKLNKCLRESLLTDRQWYEFVIQPMFLQFQLQHKNLFLHEVVLVRELASQLLAALLHQFALHAYPPSPAAAAASLSSSEPHFSMPNTDESAAVKQQWIAELGKYVNNLLVKPNEPSFPIIPYLQVHKYEEEENDEVENHGRIKLNSTIWPNIKSAGWLWSSKRPGPPTKPSPCRFGWGTDSLSHWRKQQLFLHFMQHLFSLVRNDLKACLLAMQHPTPTSSTSTTDSIPSPWLHRVTVLLSTFWPLFVPTLLQMSSENIVSNVRIKLASSLVMLRHCVVAIHDLQHIMGAESLQVDFFLQHSDWAESVLSVCDRLSQDEDDDVCDAFQLEL